MNVIALIVILIISVLGVSADPRSLNTLENQLLTLLERWRLGEEYSFPVELPSLEKIIIDPVNGNYKGKGVKLSYTTSEMELTGLEKFSVDFLSAEDTTLEMSITVTIPAVKLYAENYKLSGRAYLIYPLKGSGVMSADFYNITLEATLQLGGNSTSSWIKEFQFDFNVDHVEVNLESSSWPINSVLNKEGLSILRSYHDDIISAVEKATTAGAGQFLSSISPQQVLDLIADTYENGIH